MHCLEVIKKRNEEATTRMLAKKKPAGSGVYGVTRHDRERRDGRPQIGTTRAYLYTYHPSAHE